MELEIVIEAINFMSEVTGYRTEAAGMKRVADMLYKLDVKTWKNMTWEQKYDFCNLFTREGHESQVRNG